MTGGIRIRLEIEYDGSRLSGFQRQQGTKTIQSELEEAVAVYLKQVAGRAGVEPGPSPAVSSSGRTDAGVHAQCQTVSFLWPERLRTAVSDEWMIERMRRALDGITNQQISIKRAALAAPNFDVRRHVLCKQYRYVILNRPSSPGLRRGRAWWVSKELDVPAMIAAAKRFVGRHDFQSFRAGDCVSKNSVRTVLLSEIARISDEEIVYIIRAKGFLKQMVRIITGTLVEIGKGRRTLESLDATFAERNRRASGRTAPPEGLFLDWVRYDEDDQLLRR